MNACAGAAYKKADGQLDAVYKQVAARLERPGQERLRDAQRAWISFRDKQCVFMSGGSDGGSVAVMTQAACLASETEARTQALKQIVTCPEGDVSCPR